MSRTEHEAPPIRTSPNRVVKMLAIIIGIQVVGGALFFTHYDFWNSYIPIAGVKQEKEMANETTTNTGPPNIQGIFSGKEIDVPLKFVESSDFTKYGFNAPFGQSGANPEIHAAVGDKIVFSVANGGKSFHAFAITTSTSGPGPAVPDTTIGTADSPMKPGQSGTVTFIPAGDGTYYYICAVPGHRELGMEGKIEVGAGQAGTGGTAAATGNKVEFSLSFEMSPDFAHYGFNAPIGQTNANPDIKVKSGDTVTIHLKNNSKSFHAFGVVIDPENPAAVLWSSAFKTPDSPMKPGESGDVTFVAGTPGVYHYICTVPGHAALGMNGNLIVS